MKLLHYTIDSVSSYEPNFPPENIYTNTPKEQQSRWAVDSTSVCKEQWLLLKLDTISILCNKLSKNY